MGVAGSVVRIKEAIGELICSQRLPHDNDRGSLNTFRGNIVGKFAERRSKNPLIRPRRERNDSHRAIGTIRWGEFITDALGVVCRQMNTHRRTM